jgi:eukaryotic-like serine/threonine-protein kinase
VAGDTVEKAPPLVGGRYELEALIGKGGVGEVWRARHVALNSPVAIKFLQPASAQRESAKRRFTTEAQLTAQLKTPSAVQVFDFGITDEGQPYLVMELLEGETLGLRLQRLKRLGVADTARFLGQAARALQRAHQLGIVHRDFKPDNIVIYPDDEGKEQVKVLDFGVAKLVGALEDRGEQNPNQPVGETTSFTRTGAVLGTPLYMAPEQILDATHVDARADIWAFGVVAFECLTGRPPFTGGNLLELFARIQSGLHADPSFVEPSVPPTFDAWFNTACAPDPEKRFTNAMVAWRQLATALGLPGADSTPSLEPNATSGERRVVGTAPASGEQGDAPAIEARETMGELRGRTHGDSFASLQRISIDELPGLATHSRPSAPSPSVPAPQAVTKGKGVWWLAGFLLVAACSAVAAWRVVSLPASRFEPTPTHSIATADLPAPSTVPSASTAAALAAGAPMEAPSVSATPAAPPVDTSLPASAHPSPPTPPAVPSSSTPRPRRPASSPPAAPRPAATPADPGSYR